jgi:hypothetical protein
MNHQLKNVPLSCFLWRKVAELKAENSDQGGEVG